MSENSKIFAVRSGTTITVFIDGKQTSMSFEEETKAKEIYSKIKKAEFEKDFKAIKAICDPAYIIEDLKYIVKDRTGRYYLKGYNTPMPSKLSQYMVDYIENDLPLDALINFWKLCLINPDPAARDGLFDFASKYGFPITDKGYFIAYKSVAWKGQTHAKYLNRLFSEFINLKVTGKKVKNYKFVCFNEFSSTLSGFDLQKEIYRTETIEDLSTLIESLFEENKEDILEAYLKELGVSYEDAWEVLDETKAAQETETENPNKFADLGVDVESFEKKEEESGIDLILDTQGFWEDYTMKSAIEQYLNYQEFDFEDAIKELPDLTDFDKPTFTDWYTRSLTINLGVPVSMPREKCNSDPNQTCSAGLHVGAPEYVKHFGHGSEQHVLAVLVNPADVVAVPHDYSYTKMRVCKYYPYGVMDFNEETMAMNEIETPYFELDYCDFEEEELAAKLALIEEAVTRLSHVNEKDSEDAITSLEEKKKVIENRLRDIR